MTLVAHFGLFQTVAGPELFDSRLTLALPPYRSGIFNEGLNGILRIQGVNRPFCVQTLHRVVGLFIFLIFFYANKCIHCEIQSNGKVV